MDEEDNNITYPNDTYPCEFSKAPMYVESNIAQILKTMKMKQLAQNPCLKHKDPKSQFRYNLCHKLKQASGYGIEMSLFQLSFYVNIFCVNVCVCIHPNLHNVSLVNKTP